MTSLAFILTEVPAPPWNWSTGNWSRHFPFSMISSHAAMIASAFTGFITLSCILAIAQAFFTSAKARMSSGTSLMVRPEIL